MQNKDNFKQKTLPHYSEASSCNKQAAGTQEQNTSYEYTIVQSSSAHTEPSILHKQLSTWLPKHYSSNHTNNTNYQIITQNTPKKNHENLKTKLSKSNNP